MLVLKGDVKYKYSFHTDFNSPTHPTPPPTYLHHNFAFLSNTQHFLPKDFEHRRFSPIFPQAENFVFLAGAKNISLSSALTRKKKTGKVLIGILRAIYTVNKLT